MNHFDSHAPSKASVPSYSLGRTLRVAVLLTVLPMLAIVAVSVPGVALAFLGGAATAGALAVVRRLARSRHAHSSSVTA